MPSLKLAQKWNRCNLNCRRFAQKRRSDNDVQNDVMTVVFVAQLVERSFPTPEIRGSNPVVGNIKYAIDFIEKTK